MEDTVRATCTNCNQKLSVLDPGNPRGTKIPLILQCSHTVCERCLMSAVREKSSITCSKCNHESKLETPISTWSKWEDTLTESFPLNLYLLGSITVKQQQHITEDKSVRFVSKSAPLTTKSNFPKCTEGKKEFSVCVECEKEADWICQTCNDLYCNQCFIKCHQFKSQSKHVKLAYTNPKARKPNEDLTMIPDGISGCAKHNGQKLDFHCIDCDLYCCSYCVAICEPAHVGHTVRPLSEIGKEIKYKLLVAKEEGTAQMNLITEELSLVNEGFDPLPNGLAEREFMHNPKKTIESIMNHFAFLHGRLQTQETKLIKEVQSFIGEEAKNTEVAVGKLCVHLNDLSFLLQETDKALMRDSTIEMIPILKKLNELKEEPYLVERSYTGKPIRFLAQESIVYDLDNHSSLEIPTPRSYTFKKNDKPLLTSLDLEKIAAMPLTHPNAISSAAGSLYDNTSRPASICSQTQLTQALCTSSRTSSVCEGDVDVDKPRPASYLPTLRGSIQAKTSEPVKVSHICSLSSFYILRIPDEKFLTDLTMRIQKSMNKNKRQPTEIKLNGTYLVVYGEDNRWYRGRVKELKGDMVEVFYIDYGNSECVSKTKLRTIPKEFMNIPPMAIHCSFANIYPTGNTWALEAIHWFATIVDGVTLLCRVFFVQPEICYVDLGQLSGDDANNIPLSISDALLFLEWAQLVKVNPMSFSLDMPNAVLPQNDSYSKQTSISVGQTVQVMVSHIESPNHLYVQQVGPSTHYIVGISKDLNATYFQPPSTSYPLANRAIYAPIIGMPCAVQFSTDKQWYRAQVTGLPGHKTVEVQYVDYGNKEIVSYTNLRRLSKKSLRIPVLATLCSLSDVAPIQGQWTKEAKTFLLKTTDALTLNMHVNARDEEDKNKLLVTLYESTDERDVSVNALVVEMGHAVSTGPSSACVETVKPSTLLSEAGKQAMFNVKPKKLKDRKRKEYTPDLVDATADLAEVNEPDPYKLEVKLLKAQDPDSIYVVVKYHVPHIENMIDEMQTTFARSVPVKIDWEPGMNCACKRVSDQMWYRGVIIEVDDVQAKVNLNDLAEPVVVQLPELRELPSRFGNQPIPIKCRLVGLLPTGGSNMWSRSACEFVEEFVKSHQTSTYISKRGDIENDLLPVEVFVCESYTPGPLDPTVVRWYTLNEALIGAGLAMPKRGEPKPEPTIIADVMLELGANYTQTTTNLQDGVDDNTSLNTSLPNVGSCDDENSVGSQDDSSVDDDAQNLTAFMRQDMDCKEDTLTLEYLPAVSIEMDTFQVIPSYVDDEGFIYFHDYLSSIPQVKEMQATLQKRFQGTLSRPQDLYWHPGQLCVVQYHLDEHWYRAQFLQYVDDTKCIVTFVDYGNVEICEVATQLRKCAFRIDVPMLAQKGYLYNVSPVGVKWTTEALDNLHRFFVEHRCKVISRSKPELGKPLMISLVRHDINLDASTMLVEGQHAKHKNLKMPVAGKSGVLDLSGEMSIEKSLKSLCELAGYTLAGGPAEDILSQHSHEADLESANEADAEDDQPISEKLGEVVDYLNSLDKKINEDLISNEDTSTQESSSEENRISSSESGSCDSKPTSMDKSPKVSRRGPRSKTLANLVHPNPLLEKISLPDVPDIPGGDKLTDCSLMHWYDIVTQDEEQEQIMKMDGVLHSSSDSCSSHGSAYKEGTNDIKYRLYDLPKQDEVEVTVLNVESSTKLIITCYENKEEEEKETKKFNKLVDVMQVEAPKQPQMYDPLPGKPCVACYGPDSMWYRAKVVQVNSEDNTILVQYVDYANYETVPFDRVVEIKQEWTELPIQGRECNLWQIVRPDHASEFEVVTNLDAAIGQRRVLAIIQEREPELSVTLMNLDRTELAYETLLETQLLLLLD